MQDTIGTQPSKWCAGCHDHAVFFNGRFERPIKEQIDTPEAHAGLACTSCHADKRGPYLWEHAPGRDGCTTCHDPHGSSNERMLVSKPPILCQRCHVATRHPSTIYDAGLIGAGATPSIRIYARSCVTCHSTVFRNDAGAGVSCESCHGPASAYNDPHQTKGSYAKAVSLGLLLARRAVG